MFSCGVDGGAKSHRRRVLLCRDENGSLSDLVPRLCVQGKESMMLEWGCFQQNANPVGKVGFRCRSQSSGTLCVVVWCIEDNLDCIDNYGTMPLMTRCR